MTRFSATAIVAVLLCLFCLSVARIPPETDDTSTAVSLPVSEISVHKDQTVNAEKESDSSVAVTSVPLTKFTFRPINRHFFGRPKHPCRHHFKLDPATNDHVEIPYGHDMFVASGENSDFEDPELIHGGRRRWVRMHHHLRRHHHHHHDEDSDSDDEDDDDKIKKISLRFEGEESFKSWKKMRKHFHRQKEEKSGFMNRVRKFFDHYF